VLEFFGGDAAVVVQSTIPVRSAATKDVYGSFGWLASETRPALIYPCENQSCSDIGNSLKPLLLTDSAPLGEFDPDDMDSYFYTPPIQSYSEFQQKQQPWASWAIDDISLVKWDRAFQEVPRMSEENDVAGLDAELVQHSASDGGEMAPENLHPKCNPPGVVDIDDLIKLDFTVPDDHCSLSGDESDTKWTTSEVAEVPLADFVSYEPADLLNLGVPLTVEEVAICQFVTVTIDQTDAVHLLAKVCGLL
jgi:hypothetical protein